MVKLRIRNEGEGCRTGRDEFIIILLPEIKTGAKTIKDHEDNYIIHISLAY